MKPKQNSANKQYRQWLWLLSVLLFFGVFLSLSLGRYSNDPSKVLNVLLARFGANVNVDPTMESIVFNVRLPRILASVMIGAMLSLSGAVYQSVFRNPLVSPDLLGVSSGAAVGAAAAILLGAGLVTRQLFAFIGGMTAVLITSLVPRILRNRSNMMLVLSGIIVGGFLSSVLAIMKFVAEEQTELSSIVFWQMGSLSSILGRELLAILPVFLICSSLLLMLSWRINILAFGDLEARTLGVNVRQVRGIVIVCASLLTASAVSISGTIGWIGLVVPHLGRLIVGSDNTRTMPLAILIGSLFMLLIDTLARTVSSVEIPLSILTGFVGAPLYAFLLYKQKTRLD
ncbi:MAG TPA: iron ABC transporter permease [Anaerolineaceae bacterium]|nr:iron ABC transporter permease [Anaerolineaceae bacterium]